MKKIFLVVLLALATTIVGCQKKDKIEYKVGDIITVDGVIYQYATLDFDQSEVFSFATQSDDVLYHDYYYYDMVNTEQKPIERYPGKIWEWSDEEYIKILKVSDLSYYASDVKYFRLQEYLRGADYSLSRDNLIKSGFIVKGYNNKLKNDVVIDSLVNDEIILGIGYRAFKGAKMKTLTITTPQIFILPGAISDCDNLEIINLCPGNVLFSTSIANNPKLAEVYGVVKLADAAFYNLPSLKTVEVSNNHIQPSSYNPGTNQTRTLYIGPPIGLYRAPFYLCANLENFVGPFIKEIDNVIYSASSSTHILHLKDNYRLNLNDIIPIQTILNPKDNTITPYYFNNGLYPSGEFYSINGSSWFKIVDEVIYIRPAYYNFFLLQIVEDQYSSFFEMKTDRWS